MTGAAGSSRIYVVDRREGRILVLVGDDDATVDVAGTSLPKPCRREGAVLRVPIDVQGEPMWAEARPDRAEEQRRLADLARRAARLRRSDPGGDVVL